MVTFMNLHGSTMSTGSSDTETGQRFLAAMARADGDYQYLAPRTGRTYIVTAEDVDYLGHLVQAIASGNASLLEDEEREVYAKDEAGHGLLGLKEAYEVWCAATSCKEIDVTP